MLESGSAAPPGRPALGALLEEARGLGFLGPGPVDGHIAHAEGFLALVREGAAARALDLGSGGGVPGLVLATALPGFRWVLLEAAERRAAFLHQAVRAAGLAARVTVVCERAEVLGRDQDHRAAYGLVVARGFGPPPVVAECAAPFLEVGGDLVVSDPPAGPASGRWPEAVLQVGLRVSLHDPGPPAYTRLEQALACPVRFPRRTGVPRRRPLW